MNATPALAHPTVVAAIARFREPVATAVANLERRENAAHGRDAAYRSTPR